MLMLHYFHGNIIDIENKYQSSADSTEVTKRWSCCLWQWQNMLKSGTDKSLNFFNLVFINDTTCILTTFNFLFRRISFSSCIVSMNLVGIFSNHLTISTV